MTQRRFSFPAEPAGPRPGAAYPYVAFPLAVLHGLTTEAPAHCQWVYQQAWEQARAVVRPSWIERDLLGVWN